MRQLTLNMRVNCFEDCFKSKLPALSDEWWDKKELERLIKNECFVFLSVNSENATDVSNMIATQFAEDIIDIKPEWMFEDIKYLFKFFRTRKDIPDCCLIGNKITSDRLMKVVEAYDRERNNVLHPLTLVAKEIKQLSLEDNRFNYPQEAIIHWVQRLKEAFPNEDEQFISRAIKDGMTGKYGEMYHLNLNTVSRWVAEAQKTKRKNFGE